MKTPFFHLASLIWGNFCLKQPNPSISLSTACTNIFVKLSLICSGGKQTFLFCITFIWKKEELPGEWKESIIVPIHKKGDKTHCNNYRGILLLPTTYKILSNILRSRLIPYAQEIIGASDATGRLLFIYSASAKYLRKNGNTVNQFISSL